MGHSAVKALAEHGVSVWLDDLSRELIATGKLRTLIEEKGVVGVTTNPTIFANALASGDAYTEQIRRLAAAGLTRADVDEAVFEITTDDVAAAADEFSAVAAGSNGEDGRVSIEVDPRLARDSAGTVAMAKRLVAKIARNNVHVKIPAVPEGLPAIASTIAEGISVNVTLIFDPVRYRAVAEAYVDGLERAHSAGRDLSKIHSVASIFISRIESEIDERLKEVGTAAALDLRGKAALAVGRECYAVHREVFSGSRWAALAAAGANVQRPLWASTSSRDPEYAATKYVEGLVIPGSVNTMTAGTLEAVAGLVDIDASVSEAEIRDARVILERLEAAGVSLSQASAKMEGEALARFDASWLELQESVASALDQALASTPTS